MKLSIARLQQFSTLALLLGAVWGAANAWSRSPMLAFAWFGLVVGGYALFLAIEFVALRHFNRHDPVPRASVRQLLAAWWGETLTAPQVFCWRQPFRAKAEPDFLPGDLSANGQRGVVFLHGFVCNRGLWTPWLTRLRAQGHAFVAPNLEPVFGSIDDYAPAVEAAVQAVTKATGLAPVLVCHSMGGLVARAWLRTRPPGDAGVHRVVTIGSPHGGTWLGRFSHVTNGRQMRLASPWLVQLAQDEQLAQAGRGIIEPTAPQAAPAVPPSVPILAPNSAPFTCWYSNCDNIVFPVSTATLAGADNRFVPGMAHVQLAFCPAIVEHTLGLLAASA